MRSIATLINQQKKNHLKPIHVCKLKNNTYLCPSYLIINTFKPMEATITGVIKSIASPETWTSKAGKTGTITKFIITTADGKPLQLSAFDASALRVGLNICVQVSIESKEYQGKHYTNASAMAIYLVTTKQVYNRAANEPAAPVAGKVYETVAEFKESKSNQAEFLLPDGSDSLPF